MTTPATITTTPPSTGGAPPTPGPFGPTPRHLKSGVWREEVRSRAGSLAAEAATLHVTGARAQTFVDEQVTRPIAEAVALTELDEDFRERWSGSQVEEAWRNLRLAEESLVRITPDRAAVEVHARSAKAHAGRRLAADDPRLTALEAELTAATPDLERLRDLTVEVLTVAHEASDVEHRTQRSFRTTLRWLTIGLISTAAVIVVLCLTAGRDSAALAGLVSAPSVLSGGQAVALAVAFGAVGALFSAIPSIAQTAGTATSFSARRDQALLKVAVGAWSGPFGLMVATAGLSTNGAGTNGSMAGFVIAAAFFGATQEAITRFADVKAASAAPLSPASPSNSGTP